MHLLHPSSPSRPLALTKAHLTNQHALSKGNLQKRARGRMRGRRPLISRCATELTLSSSIGLLIVGHVIWYLYFVYFQEMLGTRQERRHAFETGKWWWWWWWRITCKSRHLQCRNVLPSPRPWEWDARGKGKWFSRWNICSLSSLSHSLSS